MPGTPKSVVMAVVIALGVITSALIVGAFVCIALDKTVPDPVWTLAGVGTGAFGTLLASTKVNQPDGPPAVEKQLLVPLIPPQPDQPPAA